MTAFRRVWAQLGSASTPGFSSMLHGSAALRGNQFRPAARGE